MKKCFFKLGIVLFSLLVFAGCESVPTTQGFTKPKKDVYSQIEYSSSLKTAVFEGKNYTLLFNDEFNSVNAGKWNIGSAYGAETRAKAHDGSWLGSKIYGNKEPYDEIVIQHMDDATYGMGKKLVYTKDGILHLICRKEKRDNDWYICYPSLMTKDVFERGTIYEFRYKMPVRGNDVVYHMDLNLANAKGFNEQGWTFKQLFLCELLSGVKDTVHYGASMWFGKRGQKKTSTSWIDNAVSDADRDTDSTVLYDTPYNIYDDNAFPYKMTDEQFYEWHTATAVYDDDRFAVYHDGLKIYEWKWADYPSIGMPQDYQSKKGGVQFVFSTGLAGDWAEFFDCAERAGKFDDYTAEYDVQVDYFRVYKLADEKTENQTISVKERKWFTDGKKSGEYTLYEGFPNTGVELQIYWVSKYGVSKYDKKPLVINSLNPYNDFGLYFGQTDLSELKALDYAIEMDVKNKQKNLEITVGLYNSKETSKRAWKMEKVLTTKDVPADGQWHKVRIPLSSLKPGIIWDGDTEESLSTKAGDFDWKNVYKILINNGPNSLTEGLEIDNIRFVK